MPLPRGFRYTHCKRGHAFDAANTYIRTDGRRACRKCRMVHQRRYRARAKCTYCFGTVPIAQCPHCLADRREAPHADPLS